MNVLYDITVRYCGSVGYLGILVVEGKEVYRTGKHYSTGIEAYNRTMAELVNF